MSSPISQNPPHLTVNFTNCVFGSDVAADLRAAAQALIALQTTQTTAPSRRVPVFKGRTNRRASPYKKPKVQVDYPIRGSSSKLECRLNKAAMCLFYPPGTMVKLGGKSKSWSISSFDRSKQLQLTDGKTVVSYPLKELKPILKKNEQVLMQTNAGGHILATFISGERGCYKGVVNGKEIHIMSHTKWTYARVIAVKEVEISLFPFRQIDGGEMGPVTIYTITEES